MIRLMLRLALFSAFLFATALIAITCGIVETITRRAIDRAPVARFCFHGASRCLGLRVRQQGMPVSGPVLLVSNHISWSDIPVLGGTTPLRFLSKAEVGRWPVIGWLARQAGTLFIVRGSGKAREAKQEITSTLSGGQSVLIFPEGTTSAGLSVLPFHSRLLQAAADAGVALQGISIAYTRDGRPDHLAPFIGDDEFQCHLPRLLRHPAVDVTIVFHPPIRVEVNRPLTEATEQLREMIAAGVQQIYRERAIEEDRQGKEAVRQQA
ncbi:lysophospholipid acyltransferase family protein [uncultured Marinobacter sp.]|uniref:lysophospholipid acyltransferase family protein n=1 Tax=uncultured Marinobacter sp. TaxID=187379 RepID=UPI002607384D|nr:lysophospholipid acyltransferase family protein [uncultured Marinobacter sp.]